MTSRTATPQAQEAILLATLTHVPFDGWTMKALKHGCEDAGFPPERAYWVFGGTPLGAVDAFFLMTDQKMLEALAAQDLETLRVRDRIALAVRTRLDFLTPHKPCVRETLSYMAHPTRAREGLSYVARSVSAMWYAAGDEATDFNYYSKRFLLGGVYLATLRYWLDDTSENHEKTEAFLEARLDQVLKIPKMKAQVKQALGRVGERFSPSSKKRTG